MKLLQGNISATYFLELRELARYYANIVWYCDCILQAWNWEWPQVRGWKVVCTASLLREVQCIPQEQFAMLLGMHWIFFSRWVFILIVPFQLQLPQIITAIYCGFYVHLPRHTLCASNIKYWHKAVAVEIWYNLNGVLQVGQYPRHLISLFFRLLYPWYWPSSCWNFMMSCIKAIMYSLFGLVFSCWEKLIKPKRHDS